jgi:hypothetical protein
MNQNIKSQLKGIIAAKAMQIGASNSHNHLQKTLFVDLDETLIKCEPSPREGLNEQAHIGNLTVWFCVRPHAYDFLIKMAEAF